MGLFLFLLTFVFGGLTFVPLLVAVVLLHAYLTLPRRQAVPPSDETQGSELRLSDKEKDEALRTQLGALAEKLKGRSHEPDVAAGYFAVCREFVPGGVNGKPPERTTPAGSVVATESPSVYQSMYRSIFDRNKNQKPSIQGNKAEEKSVKRARNVFYVVLRLNHLMLYDDVEQLEVRHVISLEYYNVDVYAGGERIPEGELWIKRNCIRLTRKRTVGDLSADSKPFCLFSENCSEKEDFYHAILQNQARVLSEDENLPETLHFDPAHMVKLVRQLHASEEDLQTRWLNAFIGRIFLGLYKTEEVEDLIRMKITKKIARVPKPNFISSIKIQNVDMGDGAPLITNPKLKELTLDGDLTFEADVKYNGNFKLEIATVARIDLGPRFKVREVGMILAGMLKKLEGHILVRIKPPPSNRIWITFEKTPKMDMSIEPVVMSRQITYGFILRAIESRILEVFGETLVYPNWDDSPFMDTHLQRYRGGIWKNDRKVRPIPDHQTAAAEQGLVDQIDKDSDSDDMELPAPPTSPPPKSASLPMLYDTPPSGLANRRSGKSTLSVNLSGSNGTMDSSVTSGAQLRATPDKPRPIRSNSFASAAPPTMSMDPATVEAIKLQVTKGQQDAAAAMKEITNRSSPAESPVGSPPLTTDVTSSGKAGSLSSFSSRESKEATAGNSHGIGTEVGVQDNSVSSRRSFEGDEIAPTLYESSQSKRKSLGSSTMRTSSVRSSDSASSAKSNPHSLTSAERKAAINQSINNATAAAKKWGWNVLNRHNNSNRALSPGPDTHHANTSDESLHGPSEVLTHTRSNSTPNAETPLAPSVQPSRSSSTSHAPPSPARLPSSHNHTTVGPGSPAQPIGRGQPLPPPGTPLPLPPRPNDGKPNFLDFAKNSLGSGIGGLKRKPVASSTSEQGQAIKPPPLPKRGTVTSGTTSSSSRSGREPPPLPKRKSPEGETKKEETIGDDGLWVVEAPVGDSVPCTPLEREDEGEVLGQMDLDEVDSVAKTESEEAGNVGPNDGKVNDLDEITNRLSTERKGERKATSEPESEQEKKATLDLERNSDEATLRMLEAATMG